MNICVANATGIERKVSKKNMNREGVIGRDIIFSNLDTLFRFTGSSSSESDSCSSCEGECDGLGGLGTAYIATLPKISNDTPIHWQIQGDARSITRAHRVGETNDPAIPAT
jgi:hypothetical protein